MIIFKDANNRAIDNTYVDDLFNTYGVHELSYNPPEGLRDPDEPDIVDKKYISEPRLLDIVVQLGRMTTDLPMYCWQIVAAQFNPDLLNLPNNSQDPASMARRNQLLFVNQCIHNLLWSWVVKQQKRLVTMSFTSITGKAMKASFYDFNGCWSQNLDAWNAFVDSFRANLADILMEHNFCEITGNKFPMCHNLLCEFSSAADSQVFRKEHSKIPCLEAWLRKWFRSWNNIKSTSPFPEIQAKAEYFRRIHKSGQSATSRGWVDLYAQAFPDLMPRAEFLSNISTHELPAKYQDIVRNISANDERRSADVSDDESDESADPVEHGIHMR